MALFWLQSQDMAFAGLNLSLKYPPFIPHCWSQYPDEDSLIFYAWKSSRLPSFASTNFRKNSSSSRPATRAAARRSHAKAQGAQRITVLASWREQFWLCSMSLPNTQVHKNPDSVPVNDMLPDEDRTQRRKGRKESLSWRFGVSILVVQHVSA